ncbi:hypothetical protein [Synoicihabitans lomoniglobus]|uniref:DUF11 domain-containing protein n=1 Tax=Synoicihabitans lomoniglobus TaxID=2909285 RepID=A0AAF0CN87_9BACT|nr:hypothetical protein [Opitutaceae bacterium LMO-M01]WED64115.1 hypothetical protein PXH66_17395 [Opitutaceae bacterium LMO-M01]
MNLRQLIACLVLAIPLAVHGATCIKSACAGISARMAGASDSDAEAANAANEALTGQSYNLTAAQYQAIDAARIDFGDLLVTLFPGENPVDSQSNLATPAQFFAAAATVLEDAGDADGADAFRSISGSTDGFLAVDDFLTSDHPGMLILPGSDFLATVNATYNYNNPTAPVPTVVSASSLGLPPSLFDNVTVKSSVSEPPQIICGPEGTQFRGAGLRTKMNFELVEQDLLAEAGPLLGALPLGTSVDGVSLTSIDLAIVSGRADGALEVLDPINDFAKLRARPGVADVYLGSIDDSVFFDRTSVIEPSDFEFSEIGELKMTINGQPVVASVGARSFSSGQDTGYYILQYFGPYAETQTVGDGAVAIDNMVSSLIDNLEIQISLKEPSALDPVSQTLFNTIVSTATPALSGVYADALSPVLRPALADAVDPILSASGATLGEADVTVYGLDLMCDYSISGTVYHDINSNSTLDTGEAGTGLTLYAKLVRADAPGGPAVQAVPVDLTTGVYTFGGVAMAEFNIIIDDNNTLSDVTPLVPPAGWTPTEQPSLQRTGVIVFDADVIEQNFGLANGVTVAGRVFIDTGAGGGVANNGVRDGAEVGQTGVKVILENADSGATLATTQTAGDGTYEFSIDGAVSAGTTLRVRSVDATGYVSTGGEVGDSAGSYDLATDAVTFTHDGVSSRGGLNFGDVPFSRLTTEGRQTAEAGSVAFYSHTFEAGTAGNVEFTVTTRASPAVDGWSAVLYHDLNADGQLTPGEPRIDGPLAVVAGERVDLVVKVLVPDAAPIGAQYVSVLAAELTAANAPALTFTPASRTDLTEVGDTGANGLILFKEVDKDLALPGETLTYTIRYTNQGSTPISQLVVRDATPTFTKLVAAPPPPLAEGLTAVTLTNPGAGGTGALTWTFAGELLPGAAGEVSFSVVLDN